MGMELGSYFPRLCFQVTGRNRPSQQSVQLESEGCGHHGPVKCMWSKVIQQKQKPERSLCLGSESGRHPEEVLVPLPCWLHFFREAVTAGPVGLAVHLQQGCP